MASPISPGTPMDYVRQRERDVELMMGWDFCKVNVQRDVPKVSSAYENKTI